MTAGRRRGKADSEASWRAGTDHVWKGLLPCCRASERASGHTGCERGLPPFLLSSLPLLSLYFLRPSTTPCIESAFSRRHDEGASDWTVDQVNVPLKYMKFFLKLCKVKLECVSKQILDGKVAKHPSWESPLEVRCRVKKVQRHYETERKRRKEGREEESRQISQNNAILVSGQGTREGTGRVPGNCFII